MKKYVVSVPLAGYVSIEVEAKNAEAAKDAAWDKIHDGAASKPDADITWEFFETIAEGNCCSAPLNEISVDEVKE